MLNSSREADSDGAGPLMLLYDFLEGGANRFRRGWARSRDTSSFANQFARCRFNESRLDSRSANINT